MNINFINHFHNGDIHYSRNFIKLIISDILNVLPESKFYYYHPNPKKCILDIDELEYKHITELDSLVSNHRFFITDGNVYINTWVGSKDHSGISCVSGLGATMKAHNRLYDAHKKDILEHLQIKLSEFTEENNIPIIDYTKYHISNIDEHISKTDYRKRFFISNGITLSGQSLNFNFDQIIYYVASIYPDCAFYMTSDFSFPTDLPNVYNTRNIIGYDGCDLNENSYLSTKCDYIVGRASGPFAFAHVKENYMDENKTICAISNNKLEGFWYDGGKVQYDWINTSGWTENIQTMSIVKDKLIEFCEK